MKEIPLTQGKVALVDDEDFGWLSEQKWCFNSQGYSVRGRVPQLIMHRVIMERILGEAIPLGMEVDHINTNKLDNRRDNLRLATHAQNKRNVPRYQGSTSQYKGVVWHKRGQKWQAAIWAKGGNQHLGVFETEVEAARAYDRAAKELFGEFAWLNFPDE